MNSRAGSALLRFRVPIFSMLYLFYVGSGEEGGVAYYQMLPYM